MVFFGFFVLLGDASWPGGVGVTMFGCCFARGIGVIVMGMTKVGLV